jgi:hypothetical protein
MLLAHKMAGTQEFDGCSPPYPISRLEIECLKSFKISLYLLVRFI